MECVVILIIGAMAGWSGSETNEGKALLCCKIIAGILGASAGYRIFIKLGVHFDNKIIKYLISSAIGAIAFTEITSLFKKRIYLWVRLISRQEYR